MGLCRQRRPGASASRFPRRHKRDNSAHLAGPLRTELVIHNDGVSDGYGPPSCTLWPPTACFGHWKREAILGGGSPGRWVGERGRSGQAASAPSPAAASLGEEGPRRPAPGLPQARGPGRGQPPAETGLVKLWSRAQVPTQPTAPPPPPPRAVRSCLARAPTHPPLPRGRSHRNGPAEPEGLQLPGHARGYFRE